MKQLVTVGIVLNRTDYGEADRILSLLTPQYGKLSLMAKGVRRIKSKLAGGIELFSVSEITFIQGRGAVGTLVSSRLVKYYDRIVKDLERTMAGYECIQRLNKVTEDETEEAYFELLHDAFEALNDPTTPLPIIQFWFGAQLLRLSGHTPNLAIDEQGRKLAADQHYSFSFDSMAFSPDPQRGQFNASHIKFLRLAYAGHHARVLAQVQGSSDLVTMCAPLVHTMGQTV
jgi:DNA repair protein RecO (recombination protein O)